MADEPSARTPARTPPLWTHYDGTGATSPCSAAYCQDNELTWFD
jgi:hypothetical protein